MEERELRHWIDRVKDGTITRRNFTRMMVGVGLTAPLAAQMLAAAGVAHAQTKPAFTPTKRGGGGTVKVLWWQSPTLLNPHFANGTKDQDGSRIFYEPLASFDPDGNLTPNLAAEVPTVAERRRRQGRHVGHLEAQAERPVARREAVHGRRRGLQLGVRDGSGHRRRDRRRLPERHEGREGRRRPRSRSPSTGRSPSRTRRSAGPTGQIIPKHIFEAFKGANVARGAGEPQARRHRRLPVRGLQAGRHGPGRAEPQLPRARIAPSSTRSS